MTRIAHAYIAALRNPWYIVAAVAFSASNRPETVPHVFQHVAQDLQGERASQLLLARKMRDALFKSGLTSGYPRVRYVSYNLAVVFTILDSGRP